MYDYFKHLVHHNKKGSSTVEFPRIVRRIICSSYSFC